MPLVIGYRAWNSPARAEPTEQPAIAAPPAHAPAVPLRVLVYTLACLAARDDILHKTPGLKNLDYQTIFGAGGGAKLSVNALWPDPIHKLLKHTSASHKQLGHLRPVVKNLTVCMRPTMNGQLIPVTCEDDVDALVSANANAVANERS